MLSLIIHAVEEARRTFREQLETAWAKNDSLLCVGLDPDLERLPPHLLRRAQPILAFNKAIVDATADLVCAYKPQIAHYAAVGAEHELERTIQLLVSRSRIVPEAIDRLGMHLPDGSEQVILAGEPAS